MSFSSQIKNELLNISDIKPCCSLAETYGLMLFAKRFSKHEMYLSTENEEVAERYRQVASRLSLEDIGITKSTAGKCKVTVDSLDARLKILKAFGFSGNERSRRINWANIYNECCISAFIRGAFLACGTINDPEKSYHVEFNVPYSLHADLLKVFSEANMSVKQVKRNNSYILYFKDSEEILDLLTFMGANDSALEYTGVKIIKEVRNNVNRKFNFENANLDRILEASYRQIEAIQKLKKSGRFSRLSPQLKEIAQLRLDNPELSLKQIGELLDPPLSRSGVNHRIQTLLDMADEV